MRHRGRIARPIVREVAWIAAVAAAASLQVWLHLRATAIGYEIGVLRGVRERLLAERAELEAALARLTSPRNLDRLARARLGLRAPEPGQIVGLP